MADISRLSRLLNGIHRNVDLASNNIVVGGVKVSADGGATSTLLTKAILDNLVTLQNGSDVSATLHHHDGRYFTETELGSNANGEGASLIGIEDAASQFTSTNVEGALTEAIDAAQAAQAAADVAQGDIDAHLDGAASKHDATEIDYERTDGSKKNIQAASDDVESALTDLDDAIGSLVQGTNYTAGSLGIVSSHLAGIDSTLGNLSSTINNFEWQESALDYIVDNTATPPSETTGDRYVLSHDGGAPNAAWDGASAGDIVEFNGTVWVATTPTAGTFIAVDDEPNVLYLWGGSSWASKAFESTTASSGLTKVGFDIQIAAQGVTAAKLGGDVAGTGLTGGAGSAIAINFGTSGQLAISAADLASTSNGLGASLIGIEDSAAYFTATNVEAALAELYNKLLAQDDAAEITYTPSTLSDWSGSADPGNVDDGLDQLASRVTSLEADATADALSSSETPAAALGLGLRAVRWGVPSLDTPETADRIYNADPTELSLVKTGGNVDPFYVIGIVDSDNTTDPQVVYRAGLLTKSGHGLTVGLPFYLDSNGALTSTVPTTAGEAVVKLGVVKSSTVLDIQIQIMGVN